MSLTRFPAPPRYDANYENWRNQQLERMLRSFAEPLRSITLSTLDDGYLGYVNVDSTWATIRDTATGNSAGGTPQIRLESGSISDRWDVLQRVYLTFDFRGFLRPASRLVAGAVVFRVGTVSDNDHSQNLRLVTGPTPAAGGLSPQNADYDATKWGTTSLSDATRTWSNGDDYIPIRFDLNQTGLEAIQGDALTRLGVRISADVDDSPPTWGSGANISSLNVVDAKTTLELLYHY